MTSDDLVIDRALKPFATELQWQMLMAWEQHGSSRVAAKFLGCPQSSIVRTKGLVIKKAATKGYVPGSPAFHGGKGHVPPGFVLRGQSALLDADGKMLKRWDKTGREGLAPDEAHQMPDPKKVTKLSTMYDSEGRVVTQWRSEKPEAAATERAWRAFAEELAKDIPRLEEMPPPPAIHLDAPPCLLGSFCP